MIIKEIYLATNEADKLFYMVQEYNRDIHDFTLLAAENGLQVDQISATVESR